MQFEQKMQPIFWDMELKMLNLKTFKFPICERPLVTESVVIGVNSVAWRSTNLKKWKVKIYWS